MFSVFISDLLEEIDRAQIGIQLKSGNKVGGLLFADDFVGITESSENLQQLIDIIYGFCSKWRLHANVNKSAVLVFGKDKVGRPGRQRKVWKRVVDDIFESLELDKGEWVESISVGLAYPAARGIGAIGQL